MAPNFVSAAWNYFMLHGIIYYFLSDKTTKAFLRVYEISALIYELCINIFKRYHRNLKAE